MTFLNFSQLPESVFRPNVSGKHFPGNQTKFSFDWKVFSVDQLFYWQTNTGKFGKWFSGNHFPGNKHSLRGKTLSKSEKFKNIILFADYNKFGPQTFDCYIFCFQSFFSISLLRIWFNLIFILILILIFIIDICFSLIIFLIEIFYLSNLVLILLIVIYFI